MPSIPRHLLRSKNKISRQLQEGEAKLNFLPLLIFFIISFESRLIFPFIFLIASEMKSRFSYSTITKKFNTRTTFRTFRAFVAPVPSQDVFTPFGKSFPLQRSIKVIFSFRILRRKEKLLLARRRKDDGKELRRKQA